MKKPDQTQSSHKIVAMACLLFAVLVPEVALAQTATTTSGGLDMFCMMAKHFKTLVGAAALLTIFLWALEHFFGVSKLHDIVIKVGIGSAVVTMAPLIITQAGLISCPAF